MRTSTKARAGAPRTDSRSQRTKRAVRAGQALALLSVERPVGYTPRRGNGLTGYERVLTRAGFGPVAGIDEAGRGACAGPLVVAAVILDRLDGGRWADVADSKSLTAKAREAAYRRIVRSALAWHVVVIEPGEIDRLGLHVCNVAGMRRALAGLNASPGYVLTDGFAVPGLAVPALAMWKGDQVAVCVAAASIVAKVTRDKIMSGLHAQFPEYGFTRHKGYSTPSHMAALEAHGPSPIHRRSFVNVSSRLGALLDEAGPDDAVLGGAGPDDGGFQSGDLAAVRSAALDSGQDGPIVELIAGSPGPEPADLTDLRSRAPASSEGRT
ncbi:MAG TPA: ribonuclease HII [Streptosporangiaceae bacterium]|nr:ribonuclease HII [Streptosporangiaceae bacterium]